MTAGRRCRRSSIPRRPARTARRRFRPRPEYPGRRKLRASAETASGFSSGQRLRYGFFGQLRHHAISGIVGEHAIGGEFLLQVVIVRQGRKVVEKRRAATRAILLNQVVDLIDAFLPAPARGPFRKTIADRGDGS